MKLPIQDINDFLLVSDSNFNYKFNESLIHQITTSYLLVNRQGTSAQKNRSEVKGTSKKPWKQKGSGRARAGSFQSPIWRSGGVTFAGKTQDYTQKINKKMYRGAIKSIFSELIRKDRLIIFEKFFIEQPKSKLLIKKLSKIQLKEAFIITHQTEKNLLLAARNLYKIKICHIKNVDPVSLITFKKTIITSMAMKKLEEMLNVV
ncbi:50S ribosomal protein L4 [Candidatus Tachikawaea gelatinosa]|uniref:50S ribosomal protein L4 n=1 Tax=Candidatus Tachikawaea gelatinosa TaxID=1410383 RepID=UPI000597D334|nr:50S ribosomal protein L4 [Candidatus Tachikawaea gelatinosa]